MADEKYKCLQNNCSKEFKHPSCRSRHHKTFKKGDILKPKTSTEYPNAWCKKLLSSLFNLKRHLLICKPKEKSNHICSEPGCNKSFNKLSRLLHHQSSHKKQTFTCDLCFTSYVRKDKFLIHKKKCEQSENEAQMFDHQPTMAGIMNEPLMHPCSRKNLEPESPNQQVNSFIGM